VSAGQNVAWKTIPLCGIVLVLGMLGCGKTSSYSYTANASVPVQSGIVPAKQELIALIQQFLSDASGNDPAGYHRFFGDDILYTRGTGEVVMKKDMDLPAGKVWPIGFLSTVKYEGDDFRVHQYGDMAIVNFRLFMRASENDQPTTRTFRNTGTFIKRDGQWQAIAWQATPITEK